MTIYRKNEPLLCTIFPSSLGESVIKWFHSTVRGLVNGWAQLAEQFTARFITSSRQPKDLRALLTLKKKSTETFREYTHHYWETMNEIEACNPEIFMASFKIELPKENPLYQSLIRRPVVDMEELMARIEKYAKFDNDLSRDMGKEPKGRKQFGQDNQVEPNRDAGRKKEKEGFPSKSPFVGVNTMFKELIYKILTQIKGNSYFKWPNKLTGDPSKRNPNFRCSYHRDVEHMIENCRSLKQDLEELVQAGHLAQFIENGGDRANGERVEPQANQITTAGVIDVIHAITTPQMAINNAVGAYIQRAAMEREFYQLTLSAEIRSKRMKIGEEVEIICFSEHDLIGIHQPHNDALVVTLRIANYDVKKLLIDPRSSSEIMYMGLFQKLGLKQENLKPANTPLVDFGEKAVLPKRKITLPVKTGPVEVMTEFLVVDKTLAYNAIMGQT